MATRNFWIDVDIDGRQTSLSGGPRSKNGGMYITILQRVDGGRETAFKISCFASADGILHTKVCDYNGEVVAKFSSKR